MANRDLAEREHDSYEAVVVRKTVSQPYTCATIVTLQHFFEGMVSCLPIGTTCCVQHPPRVRGRTVSW